MKNPGWVEVQWSKPTGAALDAVGERLKALKLTIRNAPMDAAAVDGACVFTGAARGRAGAGRAFLLMPRTARGAVAANRGSRSSRLDTLVATSPDKKEHSGDNKSDNDDQ